MKSWTLIALALSITNVTMAAPTDSIESTSKATSTAEHAIREALAPAGIAIDDVRPGPINGLYTVIGGGNVVYVDATARYLIEGQAIDLKTHENLTQSELVASLPRVDWKSLPLVDAIKTVKGNGKRQMAVFSDPDCPYCHMLEERSLAQLNDVTVYTFLLPLDQRHPDATRKARLIWCADDRASAWDEWMHHGRLPEGNASCDVPLEDVAKLARELHVFGTPGLVFPDGSQLPGAQPADVIERHLAAEG